MAVVPQKTRRERNMFAESDDSTMMELIQATHHPNGREFSVKPLLHIVEHVFLCATPAPGITNFVQHQEAHQAQFDELDEKVLQSGFQKMMDMLSYTIFKISCQMSSKCYGGGDDHATTMEILNLVSNYSWDAKVVLALAAFAVNYGEFWLVTQLYLPNPLAKAVAFLQQLPDIIERQEDLKPKLEELTYLIRAMTDVAKCVVELEELPSQYITPDTPELLTAAARIPTAVYWTIRSIVACTSQIAGLVGMGHEYTAPTAEASELPSLAQKVTHLKKQLTDEKRNIEAYLTLVRLLDSVHIDNMEILKALIYAKDDQLPLFHGSTRKRAGLDLLRRKGVLLLISDLELSHKVLSMLEHMYSEAREQPERADSQYEMVWLPVVDRSTPWDETKKNQFETTQSMMPWYSVRHPSLLDVAVIRYIKEVWHFNKKALLVVLDPRGKLVNPNAIHMLWIWGSLAFPFTSSREETLWIKETWNIEFLVDGIDASILSWIEQGKFICLYGGEDIEWIRKFTTEAKTVAKGAGIQLEMFYVGKSNPGENARKINGIIENEKLSHKFPNLTLIWFFWERLESMWHSKVQLKRTVASDTIMKEILAMLSFDGSDQGWAVISKGSDEMVKEKGETLLKSFVEFETWRPNADEKGFLPALNDYLHPLSDEKRNIEAYLTIVRLLDSVHIDNMEILKALIYAKDDQLPLFHGSTRKRAGLDLLRRKGVLLLISDLDLSHEELSMLEYMYSEAREQPGRADSQYEMVWLPVVDRSTPWDETKKNQFENTQSVMPWYSVRHPSLLDVAVIRYIKEVWHFNKKALLVVLDPRGKVVNPNAIHMMWIWGGLAFPFTSSREEALWKEETWKMELLVDSIDPRVSTWIEQGKFICLYGGEDIGWIRKFTAKAKAVAEDARIQLELVYVGTSDPGEITLKIGGIIAIENLSHILPDLTLIWFFWERLESMWRSRVQQKGTLEGTLEGDAIMEEVLTMFSFDENDQGWAVIGKGSDEMAKAKGEILLKSFVEFETWKQSAERKGFLPALIDHLHEFDSPSQHNRLILPGATGESYLW